MRITEKAGVNPGFSVRDWEVDDNIKLLFKEDNKSSA